MKKKKKEAYFHSHAHTKAINLAEESNRPATKWKNNNKITHLNILCLTQLRIGRIYRCLHQCPKAICISITRNTMKIYWPADKENASKFSSALTSILSLYGKNFCLLVRLPTFWSSASGARLTSSTYFPSLDALEAMDFTWGLDRFHFGLDSSPVACFSSFNGSDDSERERVKTLMSPSFVIWQNSYIRFTDILPLSTVVSGIIRERSARVCKASKSHPSSTKSKE